MFAPKLALVLLVLPFVASPALAQSPPIHVTAHTSYATANPGGFQEVGCQVDNLSDESLMVQIVGTVTYADGAVQTLYRPGQPVALGPDMSFVLFIFFIVPDDAALGTATFECSVRAVGVQGGSYTESATSTFEVVPA